MEQFAVKVDKYWEENDGLHKVLRERTSVGKASGVSGRNCVLKLEVNYFQGSIDFYFSLYTHTHGEWLLDSTVLCKKKQ